MKDWDTRGEGGTKRKGTVQVIYKHRSEKRRKGTDDVLKVHTYWGGRLGLLARSRCEKYITRVITAWREGRERNERIVYGVGKSFA